MLLASRIRGDENGEKLIIWLSYGDFSEIPS